MGRTLRRSQVQPPAHSKASFEMSPGWSGIFLWLLKTPKDRACTALLGFTAWQSPLLKFFSRILSEPLLFHHIASHPPVMHRWRSWLHCLVDLPVCSAKKLLDSPQSCLFSRLKKPSSPSLSSQGKCSSPQLAYWYDHVPTPLLVLVISS